MGVVNCYTWWFKFPYIHNGSSWALWVYPTWHEELVLCKVVYLSSSSSSCHISLLFVVHILPCRSSSSSSSSSSVAHHHISNKWYQSDLVVRQQQMARLRRETIWLTERQGHQHLLSRKWWHSPTQMWNFRSLMERISPFGKRWCMMYSSSDVKSRLYDTTTNQPQWHQKNGVHWTRYPGQPFKCI